KVVKQRFGEYVAKGPVVLAGFGEGADEAALLARQEPAFFSRLVLVEGGQTLWSATAAGIFKAGGGERVLFVCSSSACREGGEQKAKITRTLDIPTELLFAGDLAGVFDGRVAKALSAKYSWLMSKDTRPLPQRRKAGRLD
ncbi:MAG TPA: hypothetical protein VGP93_05825, partial [Polyangiaceae bacterium]|nr:hypothetical protein [Polyangiaceae bacterium]